VTNPYLDELEDNPYLTELRPTTTLGQRPSFFRRAAQSAARVGAGVVGTGEVIPETVLRGVDALLGWDALNAYKQRQRIRRERWDAATQDAFAPEAMDLAGNLVGTALLIKALGPAAAAKLSGIPMLGRLFQARQGLKGLLARNVAGAVATSPLAAAQAIDPATSTSTMIGELTGNERMRNLSYPGRLATELGAEVAAGSTLEGALRGVAKGARGLRQLSRNLRAPRVDLEDAMFPGMVEADTPLQTARMRLPEPPRTPGFERYLEAEARQAELEPSGISQTVDRFDDERRAVLARQRELFDATREGQARPEPGIREIRDLADSYRSSRGFRSPGPRVTKVDELEHTDIDAAPKARATVTVPTGEVRPKRPLTATGYEKAASAGNVGTAKNETVLTPGAYELDPTGRSWVEERLRESKTSPKRYSVSDKEAQALAGWVDTDRLIGSKKVSLDNIEMRALAQVAVDGKRALQQLTTEIEAAAFRDPEKVPELNKRYSAAMAQLDAALAKLGLGANEAGRTLRAVRFLSKEIDDPVFWLNVLRRKAGVPAGMNVPTHLRTELESIIAKRTPDGLPIDAQRELVDLMRRAQPKSSLVRRLLDFTRAGLLTSPGVHIGQLSGNTLKFAVDRLVAKPIAVAMDRLLPGGRTTAYSGDLLGAAAAGVERVVGSEASSMWKRATGIREKLKAGKAAARNILQADEGLLALIDQPGRVNYGESLGGRLVEKWVSGIYGTLGAEDRLFKGAAFHLALQERAIVRALNEVGRKSPDFKRLVQQYSNGSTAHEADVADAILAGELATFTEKNVLAERFNKLKQIPYWGPAIEAHFLFVKSPTNIIKQTLVDYTPVGIAKTLWEDGVKGLSGKDLKAKQRIVEAIGKGSAGAGILAIGAMLYLDGKLSPSKQLSDKDLSSARLESLPPSALRTGDGKAITLSRYGPIGMLLAMGADIAHAVEHDNIPATILSPFRTAKELPMLKGANTLTEVFSAEGDESGNKLHRWAGDLAGRVVPSAVHAVSRASDPVQRKTETVDDIIRERIPGLRKSLPEKLNALGQPVPGAGKVGSLVGGVAQLNETSVVKEVLRSGATVSAVEKLKGESDEAYALRRPEVDRAVERALKKLIRSPHYTRSKKKEELIEDLIRNTRRTASRHFVARHHSLYFRQDRTNPYLE